MTASERAAEAPLVLRRDDGGVVTLTLNRGERFNPLSAPMISALEKELDAVREDRTARVVVLAGAGKGFCAGHDLKEMRAHSDDRAWQQKLFDDCGRTMVKMTELPQPIIARVHGIATAAGCQLVSMCDLAVASDQARFALPGVNVGIFCSTPAVGVARNIGRKRSMEMLLTGELIDATTALGWGLVNRVVPAADLLEQARAFAERLAAGAPLALRYTKLAVNKWIKDVANVAFDASTALEIVTFQSEDHQEALAAIREKRKPAFKGR